MQERAVKLIDENLLQALTVQARENPRLRQNYNLHESLDDACQRLLNAMEPGSYIRPHRHSHPQKQEGFIAVRGVMAALTFDEQGDVQDVVRFGPLESVVGVDIPTSVWHTVVSVVPGSIFYEVKAGPYQPIPSNDFAPWAPEEGNEAVASYLDMLKDKIQRQWLDLSSNDRSLLRE